MISSQMPAGKITAVYKRIYLGLLLDLLLLFILPAVFLFIALLVSRQAQLAGIPEDQITASALDAALASGGSLLYGYFIMRYVCTGLCILTVISGLSETDGRIFAMSRARLMFTVCFIINALTLVFRISDASAMDLNSGFGAFHASYLFATVLTLIFRCLGMRDLLRGYGSLMEDIGVPEKCKTANSLKKHIIMAGIFLCAVMLADIIPTAANLSYPMGFSLLWLFLAAAAFIYYIVIRIQIVCFSKAVMKTLMMISS